MTKHSSAKKPSDLSNEIDDVQAAGLTEGAFLDLFDELQHVRDELDQALVVRAALTDGLEEDAPLDAHVTAYIEDQLQLVRSKIEGLSEPARSQQKHRNRKDSADPKQLAA